MIWYSMILHSMYIFLTLYDVGWFDQNLQISPHHIHIFGLRAAILGLESKDTNNSLSGWNVGLDMVCTPNFVPPQIYVHECRPLAQIAWVWGSPKLQMWKFLPRIHVPSSRANYFVGDFFKFVEITWFKMVSMFLSVQSKTHKMYVSLGPFQVFM